MSVCFDSQPLQIVCFIATPLTDLSEIIAQIQKNLKLKMTKDYF